VRFAALVAAGYGLAIAFVAMAGATWAAAFALVGFPLIQHFGATFAVASPFDAYR
jgi:hypothetical protein